MEFLFNTTQPEDIHSRENSTSPVSWQQADYETTDAPSELSLDTFPLYKASKWIWRVSPPVTLAFGTFGNVMAIVILSRMRSGWSAMNLYPVSYTHLTLPTSIVG